MSINIHRNLRAQVGVEAARAETVDPKNAEVLQKLQSKIEETEQYIKENGDALNEDQLGQLEFLLQTMKAEEGAIQGFGINGTPEDENGDGVISDEELVQRPTELEDGWNGHYFENTFDRDRHTITANRGKYGEYIGTIEMEAGSATGIAFSLSPDDIGLKAESRGRDLIVTIENAQHHKRSYVIREGSVRPEPIIFDATRAAQAVNIDLSRAFRVSDGGYNAPAGTVSGFYVHGSEFDDVLIGSQGDDKIVGWAGDDDINAMGGADDVFGDEFYIAPGGFRDGYGGRDKVNGGAGEDRIFAGGNIDTRYSSDNGEYNVDLENNRGNEIFSMPDNTDWVSFNGNAREPRVEDNVLVFAESDEVTIDMARMEGYNMAFAEGGENGALIITFVGERNGSPITFKMKIEGFFNRNNGRGTHLTINGTGRDDIIDFSKLQGNYELTNQILEIHGGAGDDMILGAENKLQREGVTPAALYLRSEGNSPAALQAFLDDGIISDNTDEEEDDIFDTTPIGNTIFVDRLISPGTAVDEDTTLSITAPVGYTEAYISEFDGKRYVTLVQPGDPAKTIVIAMPRGLIEASHIQINAKGEDGKKGKDIQPVYLSNLAELDGFVVLDNGGNGQDADVIYAQRGSRIRSDGNDYVVEGDSREPGLDNVPGRADEPEEPEEDAEEPANPGGEE